MLKFVFIRGISNQYQNQFFQNPLMGRFWSFGIHLWYLLIFVWMKIKKITIICNSFLLMHLPGLSALGLLWLLDHADWNKRKHNSTVPTVWGVTPTWGPKPCWIGIRKRRRRTPWCMKRVCSDFLINCKTWIMTLRSSDLQSDSDLDSIRNSCDVFMHSYC